MKNSQKWKLLGLCLLLPWTAAQAQVEVNVSGAQVAARPIAILPVQGDPGVKMDYLIASDLQKTGLFQPLDPKTFPENPASPAAIQYPAWKQAGADYVVMGMMQGANAGQFVLNDVNSASQLANENLHDADARQLAHQTADWILYRLTGKRGVFGTQLAYVLEQGGAKGARRYSLLVSDVDGANRREIYSSNEPILSPSWAPNGRAIAFVTYANHHAQVVIQEIGGGSRVVAQGDGISSAPAFSPDGNYIYFTSDRSGSPQIYRMSRNGGGAERVVSGSGYSANSDLSPDGSSLVLTRQSGGGYQIGTYDLASKRFDALTSGRLDEGASFAPNGQLIIYATKEGGRSVLKVINSKGGVAQTLSDSNGRLRDPAWGPDTRPQP